MEQISVGARLKQFREQRGLTLKQIAAHSGLSIGFISQVEHDQTYPSLASLKKLASALNVRLKDIFEDDGQPHFLQRKGEGTIMMVHNVRCELLATINDNRMEPVIKYIEPHTESGKIDAHEGEEFVYVESGSITVYVGDAQYELLEGDSIYFKASEPHGWINHTENKSELLWIITPRVYT